MNKALRNSYFTTAHSMYRTIYFYYTQLKTFLFFLHFAFLNWAPDRNLYKTDTSFVHNRFVCQPWLKKWWHSNRKHCSGFGKILKQAAPLGPGRVNQQSKVFRCKIPLPYIKVLYINYTCLWISRMDQIHGCFMP